MGQRLLELHGSLVVDFLKAFTDNKSPRHFEVIKDPLPDDTEVLAIRCSPYHENVVEMLLASKQWEEAPPRTRVAPICKVVFDKARGI
jgi:hypothetical protein